MQSVMKNPQKLMLEVSAAYHVARDLAAAAAVNPVVVAYVQADC